MALQPLLYLLLGTEEIVDSSTASQENPSRGRLQLLDSPILEDQMDALTAILRGIFDRYFLLSPFRVDQRDEV